MADRLGDAALAVPPVNLLGRISWLLPDYLHASQLLARSTEQMLQLGNSTAEATAAAYQYSANIHDQRATWRLAPANRPPVCQEAIHLAEERREKFANTLVHRTLAEALGRADSRKPGELFWSPSGSYRSSATHLRSPVAT
jgi:hypothetical protein